MQGEWCELASRSEMDERVRIPTHVQSIAATRRAGGDGRLRAARLSSSRELVRRCPRMFTSHSNSRELVRRCPRTRIVAARDKDDLALPLTLDAAPSSPAGGSGRWCRGESAEKGAMTVSELGMPKSASNCAVARTTASWSWRSESEPARRVAWHTSHLPLPQRVRQPRCTQRLEPRHSHGATSCSSMQAPAGSKHIRHSRPVARSLGKPPALVSGTGHELDGSSFDRVHRSTHVPSSPNCAWSTSSSSASRSGSLRKHTSGPFPLPSAPPNTAVVGSHSHAGAPASPLLASALNCVLLIPNDAPGQTTPKSGVPRAIPPSGVSRRPAARLLRRRPNSDVRRRQRWRGGDDAWRGRGGDGPADAATQFVCSSF